MWFQFEDFDVHESLPSPTDSFSSFLPSEDHHKQHPESYETVRLKAGSPHSSEHILFTGRELVHHHDRRRNNLNWIEDDGKQGHIKLNQSYRHGPSLEHDEDQSSYFNFSSHNKVKHTLSQSEISSNETESHTNVFDPLGITDDLTFLDDNSSGDFFENSKDSFRSFDPMTSTASDGAQKLPDEIELSKQEKYRRTERDIRIYKASPREHRSNRNSFRTQNFNSAQLRNKKFSEKLRVTDMCDGNYAEVSIGVYKIFSSLMIISALWGMRHNRSWRFSQFSSSRFGPYKITFLYSCNKSFFKVIFWF